MVHGSMSGFAKSSLLVLLVPLLAPSINAGSSDLKILLPDDDMLDGARRVRISFRGETDETASGANVASYNPVFCNGDSKPSALSSAGTQIGAVKNQKKDRTPTSPVGKTGGMVATYNVTTGIQMIRNRGGYDADEAQDLIIDGPGTLYTVHLDLEPRDDYVELDDSEGATVKLTGNYSACLRMRTGLETAYMDNNLAPETQYSESFGDYHTTEETQNHQDDLCHNILTGKLLMPDPVHIGDDGTTLKWRSDGDDAGGADSPGAHSTLGDFYEGFELLMAFADTYTADVSGSGVDATHVCLDSQIVAVDDETGLNGMTPPSSKPERVYFKDDDLNKLKINGLIEIQAEAGSTETEYLVTLEKFEPAGRWGYVAGQLVNSAEFSNTERSRDGTSYGETTVFGPRDTFGHKGAALPYYPTGGSTGTEAPRLMGGGPSGARVFNKHGDVIPGSARGMHPDYQAAEELIDVQQWTCQCTGMCSDEVGNPGRRCQVNIARTSGEATGAGLQRSQGSPPAPMYQLRVRACEGGNCNLRDDAVIQLIDIAEYEPDGQFYGDLDPKTRVLQGMITVITPAYAMGVRGYRAYPTSNGDTNLPLIWSDNTARESSGRGERSPNPQFLHVLEKHCPPETQPYNDDRAAYCGGAKDNEQWCNLAKEPCGNDNPYSPKCLGKSCAHVNILSGSGGEFYISRFDNNGNAENPQTMMSTDAQSGKLSNSPQEYTANTAQRNYSHNEYAEIYLPKSGWLTPIMMDVNVAQMSPPSSSIGVGDTLRLYKAPNTIQGDLVTMPLSSYIDLPQEESLIIWVTDEFDTAQGFTLIFQPNYPEIMVNLGTPMAQGASGVRLVPVYHANPTLTPLTDLPSDDTAAEPMLWDGSSNGEEGEACEHCDCVGCAVEGTQNTDAYVETYDWLVPNVTCTPTTIHCPLPMVWAHINYTTPSLYPEPAEGSCLQQKTGTSSLSGCSDKMNLDTRWHSSNSPTTVQPGVSLQNTDEEDNGQRVAADTSSVQYNNWAGNCGDASSYFWFEKIACGSTRTFHTDRSLIEDHVQLTPTWEDVQQILDLYYTTKAPLAGGDGSVGFTFINDDYHIPPVLPPKINCTCHAAMDAYASLLSVVSKTPTPGAPVTLDPEVLNSGTSKIVATLRMYQDPTYSIPASSVAPMPIVVSRFYLEVSTKFTRNRITISDCTASSLEGFLNETSALRPRQNYCDNSTFDTMTERSPNGVTHMDRISMKKFKFQTTTDVFVQCKIRACAQQPCGICTGTGSSQSRNLQDDVDLNPMEGEMFSPPFGVKISPFDTNALVFADTIPDEGWEDSWSASASSEDTGGALSTSSSGSGGAAGSSAAKRPDDPSYTKQPIQIAASLVLGDITASWAIQNRKAVAATLRETLNLLPAEELVLTRISKFADESGRAGARQLQAKDNVRIDYVIGVEDRSRAEATERQMTVLATGDADMLKSFTQELDVQLVRRGKPAARLDPASFKFGAPKTTVKAELEDEEDTSVAATDDSNYASAILGNSDSTTTVIKESDSGRSIVMMGVILGALALAFLGATVYMMTSKKTPSAPKAGEEDANTYASKVATMDASWTPGQAATGSWGSTADTQGQQQQGWEGWGAAGQQGWGGQQQGWNNNQPQGWNAGGGGSWGQQHW